MFYVLPNVFFVDVLDCMYVYLLTVMVKTKIKDLQLKLKVLVLKYQTWPSNLMD